MRYIDADALKNDILMKYKKNWEVPCLPEDRIIQRVITDLRVLIERSVTTDVVPKSEVDFLRKTIAENAQKALEVTLEEIEKAKAVVAREIFEEIDNALFNNHCLDEWSDYPTTHYYDELKDDIAEIKKKYTEGET